MNFQQLSTTVKCDDCVNSCNLQPSQFAMTHSEQLKTESENEIEDLQPTKIFKQACALEHTQSSFPVSALLTRMNFVGTLTSLIANMRKVKSSALKETNDDDETLFESMQQTDNASFNQGVFESTHHTVYTLNENDKEEMNVQSHHNFNAVDEKNEVSVETDSSYALRCP